MTRTLMTREELSDWLTHELHHVDDCENCSVWGIVPLRQPDHDCWNQSDGLLVRNGNVPSEYFQPYLRKIMAEAKSKFNLT